SDPLVCKPAVGVVTDAAGFPVADPANPTVPLVRYGNPTTVTGLRLQDARASYGIGLETFALGFPIHFDWSWRTLLNRSWEDVVFACTTIDASARCVSGAADFRKPRFAVWIGYDF